MMAFRRNTRWPTAVPFMSLCALLASPCIATGQTPDQAAPVAKLSATRLNGPAPLAVIFDATGTTAPANVVAFHELTYEFDFGDDKSATWEHSGQPRNTQIGGPLAAHVFDDPGTYTVRLRARTSEGATSEDTVTVVVDDPNAIFPGERTVCVSTSGAYADCPAGALHDTLPPRTYAGKRVLLRRGESFGIVSINRNNDGILVGAFGSGAKPIVQSVIINSGKLNDKSADDVTIMDLDISDGIQHSGSGSRYLLYRNALTRPGGNNSIDIGGALDYIGEHHPKIPLYVPREIFVIDNIVTGQINNAQKPFMNLLGAGAYFAVMGNDMSRAQEHTVRLFALYKSVIAHNALRGFSYSDTGEGSIRSVLKIHSGGLLPYADNWYDTKGKWATSQLVIADNLLGDAENASQFTSALASENLDPGTMQGIEDAIIERNKFVRGPYTNTEMFIIGRRITTRQNVRVDGGVPNLSIGTKAPSLPDEWYGPFYRQ